MSTNIPKLKPDELDRKMLSEMESDSDCREFVSESEAMRELGLI